MLLLSEGSIIDGSGAPPFVASVLIEEDRILEIGSIAAPPACETLTCSSLTIAPGFIDLHSHSDLQVLEHRTEKLEQGVTSEVVGNCGFSPFPFAGDPAPLREFAAGILGKQEGWGWPSARDYMDSLTQADAQDWASVLVGHGSLRIAVHGLGQEELSTAEMHRLGGLLEDSLSAGCVGLSTGLMYAPGSSATREELLHLCRIVARRDALYASHIRSYGRDLVSAVREQIDLAESSGCRLQISHLQAAGRAHWDEQRRALDEIEAARSRGVDVEFDIYPYVCGSTVLTQLLPLWALNGGVKSLLGRLNDAVFRKDIATELPPAGDRYWADVTISSVNTPHNQRFVGQTLTQIAASQESPEVDSLLDLLSQESGAVNIVTFNQSDENLRELLQHELCSVITDGFYVRGNPHPRLYGTYPELLATIVRDRHWLTISEAVHKSAAQPAARLKLAGRGHLTKGSRADLVIFNAERIASRSTYSQPRARPEGILFVIKNGKIVYRGNPS